MTFQPFTYRAGLASGMTPGQLRSRKLNHEIRGVRSESAELSLADRCRMLALRMPERAFFSHTTAALLLDVPLPWQLEKSTVLHVGVPSPSRAPHAAGIAGHQLEVGDGEILTWHGIRHTSAARTWRDLGAQLSLHDLVAAGDFVIQRRLPLATRAELQEGVARFAGRRGARRLREALTLLNDRSESRPESILRVIMQLADLPAAEINHTLVDTHTGKQLRPDFTFRESATILEYQGDYHRTKVQWRKDMTRRSRLETQGWKVMELNWDDLKDSPELVRRIRTLLAR